MSANELKQQLVDCIRMLEQSDIIDYNGHCSIRLDDGRILINIGSCQRSRLTVDDLCTVDLEANQLEGKGNAPLDSPNSINTRAMADRLAATLGDRPAALMKSHGAVTVGKDIVEAFVLANYMEENAYRQYMALQIGKPYAFSEEEIALCREKLWNAGLFKRTWDHFRAKLG